MCHAKLGDDAQLRVAHADAAERAEVVRLQRQDPLAELDALREVAREVLQRRQPVPVCKSTSELGCRGQTSEFSSSVKSTSIRLIFGRIDCSHRVLEAQPKSLRQNIRV